MSPISVRSVADWLGHKPVPTAAPQPGPTTPTPPTTISDYLIQRLHAHGVRHVFGIPGDYCVAFYNVMQQSGLVEPINTADEQGAGYAADVYARVRGLGACCFTYAVGGLKAVNTTAEAYVERSPVVVISGAPGVRERTRGPLLHHVIRDFDTQLKIFREVTVDSTVLDNPATACDEIDRVLSSALRHKRPVYIEFPRDMFLAPIPIGHEPAEPRMPASNPDALGEALAEAIKLIGNARQPVVLAGEELQRFGLEAPFLRFVEEAGIPFATSLLAKALISERHPLCLGVYDGALAKPEVRAYVESSDCLILLGMMLTDINLGLFTARIDPERAIYVGIDRTSIFHHSYEQIQIYDFVRALASSGLPNRAQPLLPERPVPPQFQPQSGVRITSSRLYEAINGFIDDDTVVTADTGEALIGSSDLFIHNNAEYWAPAFYTAVGFAVPAAMGAQSANRARRPLVLAGDAAFQMTGVELSTMARYGLNAIVIVANNGGYGSERPLHDGPFLDVKEWRYHLWPDVIGAGKGYLVETEEDLAAALRSARAYTAGPVVIEVRIARDDYTPAFRRFLELFAKGVK